MILLRTAPQGHLHGGLLSRTHLHPVRGILTRLSTRSRVLPNRCCRSIPVALVTHTHYV